MIDLCGKEWGNCIADNCRSTSGTSPQRVDTFWLHLEIPIGGLYHEEKRSPMSGVSLLFSRRECACNAQRELLRSKELTPRALSMWYDNDTIIFCLHQQMESGWFGNMASCFFSKWFIPTIGIDQLLWHCSDNMKYDYSVLLIIASFSDCTILMCS